MSHQVVKRTGEVGVMLTQRENLRRAPALRRRLAALGALVCLAPVLGAAMATPAAAIGAGTSTSPATVTAEALPTPQTNGIVWSVTVVGTTAYAAGNFDRARPSGTSPGDPAEVVRTNVLAFDVSTGALLPFAPAITASPFTGTNPGPYCEAAGSQWRCDAVFRVLASPDGRRLYIGGDFDNVNGVSRSRLAGFDTATGLLLPDLAPVVNSRVRALAVNDSTLYIGGDFTDVGGAARQRLAAFDLATGALLPWAPTADEGVRAIVLSPDESRLVVGGTFDVLNGAPRRALGAVDAITGASTPWSSNVLIGGTSRYSIITDLVVDDRWVYGSAEGTGGGVFDGRLSADPYTGDIRWLDTCLGASQGVAVSGRVLYSVSHSHDCSTMNGHPETSPRSYQRFTAETTDAEVVVNGKNVPAILPVFPTFDYGPSNSYWKNGTWAVAAGAGYVVVGGEFLNVNGKPQQGLVRFGPPGAAPQKSPPQIPFRPPTGTSPRAGVVRLAFTGTWDRDDPVLRYDVYRNNVLIGSQTATSSFWRLPPLSFVDSGLVPGSVHTYRVRAVDPDGNYAGTPTSAPITVRSEDILTPGYAQAVADSSPSFHWRLGERSGSTAVSATGSGNGTYRSGIRLGEPGAILDDENTAVRANGSTSAYVSGTGTTSGPSTFSVEAWVRTTSTAGGRVVGFGSSTSGTSSSYDRHIYLDNSGQPWFGVYPGAVRTVRGTTPVNDGAWHHLVGTLGGSGMTLYVDGQAVANDPTVTSAQSYGGVWRAGYDNLNGWPSRPSASALNGYLDEVAVYPTALSGSDVAVHWAARTPSAGSVPNVSPLGAITSRCTGTTCAFDSATSRDTDGAIASAAWTFDDGGTATGAQVEHTFATGGPHTATLQVTDDRGSVSPAVSSTVTLLVTSPMAAISSSCTYLRCTFDASASSGGTGTGPLSVAWAFGDGTTDVGMVVTHDYATAGRQLVTATVTDPAGGVGTGHTPVTLTTPPPVRTAFGDTFERTEANGFGTSDTGGPWSVQSTASSYAVGGGAGRITAAAGFTRAATLEAVRTTDAELAITASVDRLPSAGGWVGVYVTPRQVNSTTYAKVRLRVMPDGTGRLALIRRIAAGDEVLGAEVVVPGLAITPGAPFQVAASASGTGTLVLRGVAWSGAGSRPPWQLATTDTSPTLLGAGSVGVGVYTSAPVTNGPVEVAFHDLAGTTDP